MPPGDGPRTKKKPPPVWMGAGVGFLIAVAVIITARNHWPSKRAAEPTHVLTPTAVVDHRPSVATTGAPPTASAVSRPPPVVVYPVSHPPSPPEGATAERAAADAFHAGDLRRARTLYKNLAAANPNQPALVDMARLLGARP